MKQKPKSGRVMRIAELETKTRRLALPIQKAPAFYRIAPGVSLGYRRNLMAGTWLVRTLKPGTKKYWEQGIADADDFEAANGDTIIDFAEAQRKALVMSGRATERDDRAPILVNTAVDNYEADLKRRGGELLNAQRLRLHTQGAFGANVVALLTHDMCATWRDGLLASGLTPASVNRIGSLLKAALALAAKKDRRIDNAREWKTALESLPDANDDNNVILKPELVAAIVAGAYKIKGDRFGELVETLATTGARISQATRLQRRHFVPGANSRLMMPVSKKGKGTKKKTTIALPCSPSLAARFAEKEGDQHTPLLTKPDGNCWLKSEHYRPFAEVIEALQLAPEITIAALRHSSIVRQLLAHVPIRVVAVNHDTSVAMIERTYSKHIDDHTDAITRAALPDFGAHP